ncbi:MAG: lysophospholipid acyltransferase family protein [Alphaproteobacteria bacterium]|nr:lysophospholipid acyltransferase family protein [Alphaproteobacteria bacterium]
MKLLKKIRRSSVVRRLAAFFITQYVKLIWLTGKWEYLGKDHPDPYWRQNKPVIGCFWHGRLLMMLKVWLGPHKFHMLISSHPDGEIIARATQKFGFGWIAGSSSRGGRKAFLDIIKVLRGGESIGVTPDGPRGPRYVASIGVIQMARLGGAAILPVSYSSTRGSFIKSWDHFFLPLPFGRGVFIYGPMIEVAGSEKSDEELRQELEDSLKELTRKADHYCGQEIEKNLLKESL